MQGWKGTSVTPFSSEPYKRDKFQNLRDGDVTSERVIPVFEITYSEDGGFGVYACEDDEGNEFSVVGSFPKPLRLYVPYNVTGKIRTYISKNGPEKQLVSEVIEFCEPETKEGIINYLQTLHGLKDRAYDIYAIYDKDSIKVLKERPLEVASMVTGIGRKSALKWQKELLEIEGSEKELMYLMSIGLSSNQANALYERYGNEVVEIIKKNPYILIQEFDGFGFIKSDKIAIKMGFGLMDVERVKAGIVYTLQMAKGNGHCYLPKEELVKDAMGYLSIYLTPFKMRELAMENTQDFMYEEDNIYYSVNYEEMTELLSKHTNSKWNNEKHRYKLFKMEEEAIIDSINLLSLEKEITIDKEKVYLSYLYDAENQVVFHINRLQKEEKKVSWDIERELEKYCKEKNIELEGKQREAVIRIASSTGGIHVLNGSAGTGKTFTLKVIVDMLNLMYRHLGKQNKTLLLAPTGKASKVASKATGMECKTIHRGLEYKGDGFCRDERNPLIEDQIMVDETSMLDILLARNLFSAIGSGSKLILLGDVKQLPSIGPGNVLNDLIKSNKVDVITLEVPKRQNIQSGIIRNANNIINGKLIEKQNTEDAFFISAHGAANVRRELLSLYGRLKTFKNYDFKDIQLLCPQRVGPIGADYMNYLIQKEFNKNPLQEKILNKRVSIGEGEKVSLYFKEGDSVIHIKNNYDLYWYEKHGENYFLQGENYLGITNGECGEIDRIRTVVDESGKTNKEIIVKYEDMYIIYEGKFDELDHAYALTIHKYQGSESKAIIAPIMMANYVMLDNNLFYTLYTRAQEFIALVGELRAVEHAIKTQRSKHRYTSLQESL